MTGVAVWCSFCASIAYLFTGHMHATHVPMRAATKVRGRLDSRGFRITRPKPTPSTPREANAFIL